MVAEMALVLSGRYFSLANLPPHNLPADYSNTKELAGYALVDFYADYALNPSTRLFARINNAFDRDYVQVPGYNTAGREWLVGVNWQPK